MAEILALFAAFLFALAATLQQKGALALGDSLGSPSSFLRLAKERIWLLGSIALLVGYVVQAAALDRGRLSVIQPLLVMTVVFALPLGYWLTSQYVGRQQIGGAAVIVVGLAVFTVFGDPASGKDDAPFSQWAIPLAVFLGIAVAATLMASRGSPSPTRKAALYGIAAGVLFGLSAALAKPTVETLHDGLDAVLTSWEAYLMAATGVAAFVIQQVSLSSGRLAASVSTVSVSNPIVAIAIGAIVLDETLARPAWHIVLGVGGLLAALAGAVAISLASDRPK